MKHIIATFSLLVLYSFSFAQIQLPNTYTFVPGNTQYECFFSDGRYNFVEYPYAHDGMTQQDVLTKTGYNFYKIKDDIYWTTGQNGEWYYYIVLIGTESVQLNSLYNDAKFKELSKWMLQKAIAINKAHKDLFFVDATGNSSFYYWMQMMSSPVIDDGTKK